jgi:hypothetical protein
MVILAVAVAAAAAAARGGCPGRLVIVSISPDSEEVLLLSHAGVVCRMMMGRRAGASTNMARLRAKPSWRCDTTDAAPVPTLVEGTSGRRARDATTPP